MRRAALRTAGPSGRRTLAAIGLLIGLVSAPSIAGQAPESPPPPAQDARLTQAVGAPDHATLTFANRPITVLRAKVLSSMPAERATTGAAILDRLAANNVTGPVNSVAAAGLILIRVADRDVLELVAGDVDRLTGETLEQKATATVANLQVALLEAAELRMPSRLLQAGAKVLGATALLVVGLFLLARLRRRAQVSAVTVTEGSIAKLIPGAHATLLSTLVRRTVTMATFALLMLLLYWWASFSLRQFPYTRPWGESLRARLFVLLSHVGTGIVDALPDLFIVAVIFFITRVLVRSSNGFFHNVETGNVSVGWAYPETAVATRRLVAVLLWLFGLVLSYPYLPGSDSEAFKGVSVFVGLVLSLGSSGIVNQMMSGLTLVYSRVLNVGDMVRIGESEGAVSAISLLSVKLRTFQGEEITIPNAVVVGQGTTNYTRFARAGGAFLATRVSIGYDTPWRQVQSLLTLAAERTPNVRRDPAPRVVQDALDDFYVQYRLVVCLENSTDRVMTRHRLHANIQDAFNEFGVQIMSPHYESDPQGSKTVPQERWRARPAAEDQ